MNDVHRALHDTRKPSRELEGAPALILSVERHHDASHRGWLRGTHDDGDLARSEHRRGRWSDRTGSGHPGSSDQYDVVATAAGQLRQFEIGLSLPLGGAIGNLIDRLRRGDVTDFIDLRWWPVFNVADTAITIGAFLVAYYYFFIHERPPSEAAAPVAEPTTE